MYVLPAEVHFGGVAVSEQEANSQIPHVAFRCAEVLNK